MQRLTLSVKTIGHSRNIMSYNGITFVTLLCFYARLSVIFVNFIKKQWSIIDKIVVIYYNMVEIAIARRYNRKNFFEEK